MQLPAALRLAIEQELAACNPAQLRSASARLSMAYRHGVGMAPPLGDGLHRTAYLAVRMPATFAAVAAALGWTRQAWCEESRGKSGTENGGEIRTMLDLGSGPGTALWAAAQVFSTLGSATAIEGDPHLIEIARRLGAHSADAAVREAIWLRGDLTRLGQYAIGNDELGQGTWDLVVCSYALNELAEAQRAEFIRRAWERTAKLLVVIEPGTKAGFANVLAVRSQLLASNASPDKSLGASLAAPCPHSLACPMAGGDWCHFAARVERTASHRRLKEAALGHEDEKFSYVAFARPASAAGGPSVGPHLSPAPEPRARIVRHPRIFSGYAQLTLCREGRIETTTVTRSQKEDWRRLKRLGWGDRW